MRLLKQALAILGGLVVIAVLAALVAPQSARAVVATLVQIVPGSTTHVGQYESQVISLFCNTGDDFCQILDASGINSGVAYTVPTGSTLIITDYEWLVNLGPASAGTTLCDTPRGATKGSFVEISCAIADTQGVYSRGEHFTTGVRVAAGVTLSDLQGKQGYGYAAIQGYLVPND